MSKSNWKKGRLWWLPPLALLVPGGCYVTAAFVPTFDPLFAAFGVILTLLTVVVLYWRVFQSFYPASLRMQWIIFQLVDLSVFLIGLRLFLALLEPNVVILIAAVIAMYIFSWVFPFLAPYHAKVFYREVWHPKTVIGRAIVAIVMGLGGSGGAWIGLHLRDWLGERGAWMALAVLCSLISIFMGAYLSTNIWMQSKGLPIIPRPE